MHAEKRKETFTILTSFSNLAPPTCDAGALHMESHAFHPKYLFLIRVLYPNERIILQILQILPEAQWTQAIDLKLELFLQLKPIPPPPPCVPPCHPTRPPPFE